MRNRFLIFLIVPFLLLPGCGKKESHGNEKSHGDEKEHAEKGGHAEEGGHGGHEEGAEEVRLKKESQGLIRLQKAAVKKAPLDTSLEVAGEVAQETENVVHVTSPQPGILKNYQVALGDTVEKDTTLFIVNAQGQEFEVKSPSHGIVLTQYLKEGDSVDTLSSVMTVADPDILRVSFNVYEKDLAGVAVGQEVKVSSITYPDRKFDGKIVFVSPRVDETSRTVKVRASVENKDHLLRLGMFVTGEIVIPLKEETLVVPIDAVQEVKGEYIVFAPNPKEDEEFLVREITIGRKTKTQVEVLDGLKEGDEVVAKGSFYLKTELLKGELEAGHAH